MDPGIGIRKYHGFDGRLGFDGQPESAVITVFHRLCGFIESTFRENQDRDAFFDHSLIPHALWTCFRTATVYHHHYGLVDNTENGNFLEFNFTQRPEWLPDHFNEKPHRGWKYDWPQKHIAVCGRAFLR